jgi:hypothetical protein
MLRLYLFPAALAVLTAVFAAGCSSTNPAFQGTDPGTTSSINPSPEPPNRTGPAPASEMITEDRTGYVKPRVAR